MAGGRPPGPMCSERLFTPMDEGLVCRAGYSLPGPLSTERSESSGAFEQALRGLEAEAELFALILGGEASIRRQYAASIRAMSSEIMRAVKAGEMDVQAGMRLAQELRNQILDAKRQLSSPLGKAFAENMKKVGRTLEELLQKNSAEIFKKDFTLLAEAERRSVYLAVIESAGHDNRAVTRLVSKAGKLSRGLWVLSIGLAVYNVATADDKAKAVGREGATVAGGMLGGAAAGAAAGLICGPGAPVCVTVGIFVGGALGALGMDLAFDHLWH